MIFWKKIFLLFLLFFYPIFFLGRPPFCFAGDLTSSYCLVIDPGHGGKDSGVLLENDLTEKKLNLSLARKIKKLTSPYPAIKVLLTRTGDYDLPIEDRAALANHYKADLFVSIHCSLASDGLQIFTYSPVESEYFSIDKDNWRSRQNRHLDESRVFAKSIEKAAQASGVFKKISFLEAPVYVLEGASMAAVEIEFGFTQASITKLNNEKYQWKIAKGLSRGIIDYVESKNSEQSGVN